MFSQYQDVVTAENFDGTRDAIVDEGCDERNGSYPYEVHVGVREGQYQGEGDWVAYRKYVGGLNRLADNKFRNFDTRAEAVEFIKSHWL